MPWIWYDDMVLDECLVDDMYDSNMIGFMLYHARWMLGWYDMYARCMLGDVMLDVC